MKTYKVLVTILLIIVQSYILRAQDPFMLYPGGTTQEFFKYVTKDYNVGGTIYHTGLINLSGYKKITSGTTGVFYNTQAPVQKLQLQGGNILLCRTSSGPNGPDINPTSKNGALLFSDVATSPYIHGKWGIEYDDQYSTGGLNFFKPVSSLTSTRTNFNLFIKNDGNVGVATNNPLQPLHVNGNVLISGMSSSLLFADNPPTNGSWGKWGIEYDASDPLNTGLNFWQPFNSGKENEIPKSPLTSNYLLFLKDNGNVGVGTNSPQVKFQVVGTSMFDKVGIGVKPPTNGKYNLYVTGGILTEELKVQLSSGIEWSDYVFAPDYNLLTIHEVKAFIEANKHLPDVPSAETVKNEGINVGEMDALLLKKIEELTLYIIELENKYQSLENRLSADTKK